MVRVLDLGSRGRRFESCYSNSIMEVCYMGMGNKFLVMSKNKNSTRKILVFIQSIIETDENNKSAHNL